MQLPERISAFTQLGRFLRHFSIENNNDNTLWDQRLNESLFRAKTANPWFTVQNIAFTLKNWGESLTEENLEKWISNYDSLYFNIPQNSEKTIALIMAGNIPLVGFHDFISVLISGNKVLAKLSSTDKILLPFLTEYLLFIAPNFRDYIEFTESKLESFDAVIATGSNNTSRYFEYYFGKYPHIIRKNRNAVAVLSGDETENELEWLGQDIFTYFGLGCRNVSKLYVPNNYNFDLFFKAIFSHKSIMEHHKYMSNYDYNKAVYLISSFNMLENGFLILKEERSYSSPISVLFYENYNSISEVRNILKEHDQDIQCIVSKAGIDEEIYFGNSQKPNLWDYADGVDTLDFLLKLP